MEVDTEVQQRGRRDDVELYVRTYTTVLRTSAEVRLRAFVDDWERLRHALRESFGQTLRGMAEAEKDMAVRLLGGTHVGYAKLTRRWWQPIGAALAAQGLARSLSFEGVDSTYASAVAILRRILSLGR